MPQPAPNPMLSAAAPAYALRASPPRGGDGLAPAQRHAVIATIVALHGAAVWGLLQVEEVREAVRAAAPVFVSFIAPPPPPERLSPVPPAVSKQPLARRIAPPPPPLI